MAILAFTIPDDISPMVLPTFNTILQNIITCYDILPKVSLRVNIDRTNLDAGAEIAQILKDKGIGDKVTPYLGKVTNENGSSDHLCLSAQEFAKNDFEFISSDVTKSNWSSRYPIPVTIFAVPIVLTLLL